MGPILAELVNQGHVTIDGTSYVGKAADGTEVELGLVGDENAIEDYLAIHVGPESW